MSTSALIDALKPFAELPTLPGFSRSAYLLGHTLIHTAHKAIAEATAPVPESDARQQARAQVESIVALVAALNCDYDRLEELREELNAHNDRSAEPWREACPTEAAELADLEEAAGDCTSRDQAEDRIREDALCVEVRSGWGEPGTPFEPVEFRIVLCTGGPHVEITGELSQGEPSRAWIEYRDWNESGDLTGNQDDLLAYAACFYFGE